VLIVRERFYCNRGFVVTFFIARRSRSVKRPNLETNDASRVSSSTPAGFFSILLTRLLS
jgi:hypothetical protein